MRVNRILQKLRAGEYVVVATVWTVPHWKIVEMIGLVGFDGVWIEMEHSDFTMEQLSQMALAARATGIEVMVRVCRGSYNDIIRPLEAGATGLLLPHCTGEDDAKEFVRMAKFAPFGWRGIGGSVDSRYGLTPFAEYVKQANEETFLGVMIERKEAIDDIDAIAAIEGIDILFIGPADLSQSYGILGEWNHPLIQESVEKVAEASKRYGKWWGMPCGSQEHAQELLKKGARFFSCISEMDALLSGFQRAKKQFENLSLTDE